jgi:hypothetical protein
VNENLPTLAESHPVDHRMGQQVRDGFKMAHPKEGGWSKKV